MPGANRSFDLQEHSRLKKHQHCNILPCRSGLALLGKELMAKGACSGACSHGSIRRFHGVYFVNFLPDAAAWCRWERS